MRLSNNAEIICLAIFEPSRWFVAANDSLNSTRESGVIWSAIWFILPKYHGRVQVELIGEELEDESVVPPRRRPLPNSPVFVLSSEETQKVLRIGGDIRLGMVMGHEEIEVCVPSTSKSVFPRHLGILGTTGGGKSTTVSGLVSQLQNAGAACILLDTEGEYTAIQEPTDDSRMRVALARRNMNPAGVPNSHVYHLVGRETANPEYDP